MQTHGCRLCLPILQILKIGLQYTLPFVKPITMLKLILRVWSLCSAVKTMGRFFRRPGYNSQHPMVTHNSLQLQSQGIQSLVLTSSDTRHEHRCINAYCTQDIHIHEMIKYI